MEEVTLKIGERTWEFNVSPSDEEALISFVEGHFSAKEVESIEGRWIKLNLKEIDKTLFEAKREDEVEENLRLEILEALKVAENDPQTYFDIEVCIPKEDGSNMGLEKLLRIARLKGADNSDWVDQHILWAQRLSSGETWENLCRNADKSECLRLVIWKNCVPVIVGGSSKLRENHPPINIMSIKEFFRYFHDLSGVSPLIRRKAQPK